jgi:hypothetical protein
MCRSAVSQHRPSLFVRRWTRPRQGHEQARQARVRKKPLQSLYSKRLSRGTQQCLFLAVTQIDRETREETQRIISRTNLANHVTHIQLKLPAHALVLLLLLALAIHARGRHAASQLPNLHTRIAKSCRTTTTSRWRGVSPTLPERRPEHLHHHLALAPNRPAIKAPDRTHLADKILERIRPE